MQYIQIHIIQIVLIYLHTNTFNMKEAISLRLESELMDFLRKESAKDFRSVNNYVEMILLKHKQEQEEKEKPAE